MKAIISCFALYLAMQTGFSCIWISGTKYNTESVTTGGLNPANRLKRALMRDLKAEGSRMEADLRNATDFDDRCDYSVAMMYLDRSKEAINLLQKLEQEKSGQYAVAANLGTAYELSGNNEAALFWIKEGIRRNPASHAGTEWLHAKILEVKIARAQEPAAFNQQTVLGLRPESIGGKITVDGQNFSPAEIADAIQYQLQERVQFVKPPDPIVASLLFDYAAIEAATQTLESAEKLLQMAVEYGYPTEPVQPLIKLYDGKIAWRKTKQSGTYLFLGLAALGLLGVLYKRGIFVLSSQALKRKN
jgi:tetratricopeptide (TPR) repeat protein